MTKLLSLGVLVVALAGLVSAGAGPLPPGPSVSLPEPSSVIGALTVLGVAGLILRSRRKN